MRLRPILALPIALASLAQLYAAETPIPPSPTEWVTDTANFLSPAAVSTLNARLSAYQRATGHQLIVYIGRTTGDDPLDDWAVRAFAQWKVGRKGLDDGLALFIMAQDRKLRIEVGYGLEATVPDVTAFRIINQIITPQIQAGHADAAVTAGIDALIGVLGGQAGATRPSPPPRETQQIGLFQWIVICVGGILFLILAVTHPTLAFFLLSNILSSGGGGGGSGGGGFSGGGGRSGGGGASGSW